MRPFGSPREQHPPMTTQRWVQHRVPPVAPVMPGATILVVKESPLARVHFAHRPKTPRAPPTTVGGRGAIRGGGRLYHTSPVDGMQHTEMIAAARQRKAHNARIARLRQQLAQESDSGRRPINAIEALALVKAHSPETLGFALSQTNPLTPWVAWRELARNLPRPAPPTPSSPRSGYHSPRITPRPPRP